jgi:hypothetical protein
MTAKLRYTVLLAGLSLAGALYSTAQAQSATGDHTWPSRYGPNEGSPVYAKPGYHGVSLTLTCKEATGILKMHGYRDIAELSCSGDVYRFEVSRVEGRFVIDIDPRTGNIVRRQQL